MARGYAVYICGGDTRPGPRGTDCPDALHDHPLPAGYVDASEEATSRLYRKWRNGQVQAVRALWVGATSLWCCVTTVCYISRSSVRIDPYLHNADLRGAARRP